MAASLRKFVSNPGTILGGIFTFLGLGGVEEDLRTWIGWIQAALTFYADVRMDMKVVDALSGDIGRWLFVIIGFSVIAFSNGWHRAILSRRLKSNATIGGRKPVFRGTPSKYLEEEAMSEKTSTACKLAMKVLTEAFEADEGYAHSWHCNIAMAIQDACAQEGRDNIHAVSNEAATRFMKLAFGVTTGA